MIDLDVLHEALPNALKIPREALAPLATTGLAHHHVVLGDSGWLARVPLFSQHGHAPLNNLVNQAANFRAVARTGHAPRLHDIIPPRPGLDQGALIVELIDGPLITLPDQLDLLAQAFAEIHASSNAPDLPCHQDPLPFLRREVADQALALEELDLADDARRQLDEELAWFRSFTPPPVPQPVQLVVTDSHPGNFLVRDGRAIIVDLEKALNGSAMLDLAHASIYTSTTWDAGNATELTDAQVAGFYARYFERDDRARDWAIPMRRILWLRAITWCAYWRAEQARQNHNWQAVSDSVTRHVAERTAHYLRAETIERVRRDWLAVDGLSSLL